MTVPTVACTHCGKPFTTDDLRGTNCRYCGTLLAHHARAQQQVAVINQMMADRNGNGIPDAYEGLVANAQANALNQAFGGAPMNPYAAAPPIAPVVMNPYAQMQAVHVQQATRAVSKVMLIVVISIIAVTVLTMGIGFVSFFLLR